MDEESTNGEHNQLASTINNLQGHISGVNSKILVDVMTVEMNMGIEKNYKIRKYLNTQRTKNVKDISTVRITYVPRSVAYLFKFEYVVEQKPETEPGGHELQHDATPATKALALTSDVSSMNWIDFYSLSHES
jgi:hypothetical protein